MKKICKIVIFNLLVFIIVFFLVDFTVYKLNNNPQNSAELEHQGKEIPKFEYRLKDVGPIYIEGLEDYYNGKDNVHTGRLPVGLNYKSAPIVIFGCSFAFGQYLNPNQNFGYKLSKALKRPVYNRGISGAGISHMYYQVSPDFNGVFYNQVPKTDTVYYVLIDAHYERMSIFSDYDVLGRLYHLRYHFKNKKPIMDNYNNWFINFLKQSYLIRALNLQYINMKIHNKFFADKITDEVLYYFLATREALEKNWNNKIKFNIILYDFEPQKITHKELLKKKLTENGFNVIDTEELTSEDLKSQKYFMIENYHPNENAWNLLTPKIIKKSQL